MNGSLLITDRASRVLYASDGNTSRTGFDVPEIVGKRPGDLWGGFMPKSYYARMWRRIRAGNAWSGIALNRTKNGSCSRERLHIAPVLDERGEAKYFLELHPQDGNAQFTRDFEQGLGAGSRVLSSPKQLVQFFEKWFETLPGIEADSRGALLAALDERYISPMRERLDVRLKDRRLVERAVSEPERFGALYEKYQQQVRTFFRFRLGDEERAEDLVQEVFLRAFRALPGYTLTNASYYTYLLRIAHNLLVSEYRSARSDTVTDADMREDGWLAHFERRDALERALGVLSELERQIILLKYRDGRRMREIAVELNRSENAVKLHASRARKKLRTALRRAKGGA